MFKEPDLEIADRIVEAEHDEMVQEPPQPVAHVLPSEPLNLRPKIVQDEEIEVEDRSANVYSSKLVFTHMVLALGFTLFWAVVFQRIFSFTNAEWIRADYVNELVHRVFLPAIRYTLFGAMPCLLVFVCCSIHPQKKLLKREAIWISLLTAGASSLLAIAFGQTRSWTLIEHFHNFAAPCVVFGYLSIMIWKLARNQAGINDEELEFEPSKLSIGKRYILVCLFPFALVGAIWACMAWTQLAFVPLPVAVIAIVGCRLSSNRRLKNLIIPSALLAGLLAVPLILVETPSLDINKWNEIYRIGLQSEVYADAVICIVIFEVLNTIKRSIQVIKNDQPERNDASPTAGG